jgi:tetratricopeptide (TPR) repeat protein
MSTINFLPVAMLIVFSLDAYQQSPLQMISPVDARIAAARRELKADPNSVTALNQLAFALIRKGRDYRDESLYIEASKNVDQALRLSPGNYDAQKLKVAVLLGLHQPTPALKLGSELNHKVPDDLAVWALLVDANSELGNYDQAERAAQWVLDLRPGSSLGFEKAALLRELFGDAEGAIEFLDEANRRTSPNDADQKAWLLTQKARLLLAAGNNKDAAILLAEAMRLFPDSQLAAAGLAQVRISEGNYSEALKLLENRYVKVHSATNLYDWAEALAAAGQTREANAKFAEFENRARTENDEHKGTVLDLISYYSDRKPDLAQALSLASAEAAQRHDAATLAAYAWALYRNGKFSEANVQMEKALAVGIRNPAYLCHAETIAAVARDTAAAQRYSKELSGMPANSCRSNIELQSANEIKP